MRIVLSITVFLTCANTQAQVTFPFADSAATWVQYFEVMVTQPPLPQFEVVGTSNICINGEDTLIGGINYRKVTQCNANYVGALRQDSGRVVDLRL